MTNEGAIEILDRRTTIHDDNYSWEDINEAIDMAIEALSLKEEMENNRILSMKNCGDCFTRNREYFMKHFNLVPKITGHWVETECVGNDNYNFECSECHHTDTHSKAVKVNYCWYCGADMR